ncbi:hypothetical protein DUI87_24976 [Hirundo rustica rustica]|uniref:Uncharacterized protein n=1 Tax=Hirundo rustica rustica TaxID=333673 RepID=A0A3M0JC65_HIRRU|nr:hypothetical protein DUI87_24976 [Hirundo rustica rustica]
MEKILLDTANAHQGQGGDLGEPAELYQGQVLPHQPMAFYDGVAITGSTLMDNLQKAQANELRKHVEYTTVAPLSKQHETFQTPTGDTSV